MHDWGSVEGEVPAWVGDPLYGVRVMPSRRVDYGVMLQVPADQYGPTFVVMHPVTLLALTSTVDEALRAIEREMVSEVDRRLKRAGLYPKAPERCGHWHFTADAMRALYRCNDCGMRVTQEAVAMLQAGVSR